VAGDPPDDSTEGLADEVDHILEEGTKAGKVPPAKQAKLLEDLISACGGTFDRTSVDRFRKQVESMPVLVATTPTMPPQPDEEILRILAHDFDPGPPGKPPSADWDTWSHVDQCPLWQAVVLSLGFEPTYFVPIPDGQGGLWILPHRGQQLPIDDALRLIPQDDTRAILRRLRIALSQPSTVIRSTDHFLAPRNFESTISLPAFGAWAVGIWPDLPAEFPKPPRVDTGPVTEKHDPAESKPLHPKERTTLLKIIGVLAMEAKLPDEPYKAAKSIVAAAIALDVSISENSVAAALKAARGLVGGAQKD
jgi:hypothetical protein